MTDQTQEPDASEVEELRALVTAFASVAERPYVIDGVGHIPLVLGPTNSARTVIKVPLEQLERFKTLAPVTPVAVPTMTWQD